MSSPVEISDDDESFEAPVPSKRITRSAAARNKAVVETSCEIDSDNTVDYSDTNLTSDDDSELPEVTLASKKTAVIKNLFPKSAKSGMASTSNSNIPMYFKPKVPGFEKIIGGVKVNLPVEPYGCQIALMFKVITAINKGQNCLLESPTGSGKTLALLCAALAWQQHVRNRTATDLAQKFQESHPQLRGKENVVEQIASPRKNHDFSFNKPNFGERSIYDKPSDGDASSSGVKRMEPLSPDAFEESSNNGMVTIHKKRKLNTSMDTDSASPDPPSTPEKTIKPPEPETPEDVRIPTIYYGARTHKQLQQVVKEFKRTFYCGEAKMTILASREYACIREFDKQLWKTKNDMCRGCTKTHSAPPDAPTQTATNCKPYDNYKALHHDSLPAAFDLEELVAVGESLVACPYYAARSMAAAAHIVFCPYNYLIEPGIRSNMQIDVRDQIIIIDEAHNIEDICRDAATQTVTRDEILLAIKELEHVAEYRYANQDILSYIDILLKTLKFWDDWFANQLPLLTNKPITNNEAVHTWQVQHFVQTLNNHNIGLEHFNEFSESADIFCRRLREDPRTLYGVSQATGALIETLQMVLGFLFRQDAKYLDDFVPALVKTGGDETRYSQFSQYSQAKETLELRLLCMNPAVVFEGLKEAKCIILASGTLTPLISLHSELATEFPLQVSPNHVIPPDRVWIGSLSTCPNGRRLECNSRGTDQPDIQDGLGQAILWVSQVTPSGVLCFLPSYALINKLVKRWRETGLWMQLSQTKRVFVESRNVRDHNDIMEDYYRYSASSEGALLFAVYRGKVSEGMDFKDHQARAVVTIGVPYPNTFDMAVKEKMKYNDKYAAQRNLLSSREWLRVQAYRALNQAVGRCVRHRGDWGAVLLVDARFENHYYTDHLSKWVKGFLGNNHHTYESLVNSDYSLESFMQTMTMADQEEH
ncbi:Fanconi anemia group J protein homolog isoform X4 [Leguminivora glycinivorella]|uniref:Fanconi anemia group J protein homolog isoform X3 n=1 Tax=Leguminivora glycinivorella TaxID=1035111 RepID=UPI0020102BAF|nr:Fanconi anemia group J protein homolog isoform X3 [Leguminivora glycinivorella]XP_047999139.1 Fanconi anemia group J protein homolog isoform X4 [Leguminivora glycinivorella]